MADFEKSVGQLLELEGGYVNDPQDPGGETFRGLSRKNWPAWVGWNKLDQHKLLPGFPDSLHDDTRLSAMVKAFYSEQYWDNYFNQINSQAIADKLLGMSVNFGKETAVSLLQRALGYLQGKVVIEDGKFGPRTLDFINGTDENKLLIELRARGAVRYVEIILRDPLQEKFQLGWMRRTCS